MTVRTRAKFVCNSITESMGSRLAADGKTYEPCKMKTVKASPVYGGGDPNHENTKFWSASPGGTFELNVVNPAAVEAFEVGKEFYVDITPAN